MSFLVTPAELNLEILRLVPTALESSTVNVEEFLEAALKNRFWSEAGDLVVKEIIFLDCLNSYYYDKRNLLSDAEYSELKDDLTWEGSSVVTMSGKEAHFVTAVAAYWRNQSILDNAAYEELKVCF